MANPDHVVYVDNQEKKKKRSERLTNIEIWPRKSILKLGLRKVCFLKRLTLLKRSQIFEVETI